MVRISSVVLVRKWRYDALVYADAGPDSLEPAGHQCVSPRIITVPWVNHLPYWPAMSTPTRNQWNLNQRTQKERKKRELFFHFQTFQLDTEQWNPFPNSGHFSAAQSASDANASSFSQMVALKVTWRLGPGRKALFYAAPAASKRQVSGKTHNEPCDPFQMTHGSVSRMKSLQLIQKRQTTTKPPAVLTFN